MPKRSKMQAWDEVWSTYPLNRIAVELEEDLPEEVNQLVNHVKLLHEIGDLTIESIYNLVDVVRYAYESGRAQGRKDLGCDHSN